MLCAGHCYHLEISLTVAVFTRYTGPNTTNNVKRTVIIVPPVWRYSYYGHCNRVIFILKVFFYIILKQLHIYLLYNNYIFTYYIIIYNTNLHLVPRYILYYIVITLIVIVMNVSNNVELLNARFQLF